LHEILHRGSSRGRNHLFQTLCRSVQGFRICAGSNFAILPLLSQSPLTQGCATARLWSGWATWLTDKRFWNLFSAEPTLFTKPRKRNRSKLDYSTAYSWTEMLYNLRSESWLALANDSTAHYALYPLTVLENNYGHSQSATSGIHLTAHKLLLTFHPDEGRRLSWHEHTID